MKKSSLIIFLIFFSLVVFARPYVIINEFMYDTPGSDTNCYVELKGTPGASLDSVKIYVINGNGGTTDDLLNLSGYVIPADSYFVIAQSAAVQNYDTNAGATADYQNSGSGYNGVDNILLVYDSVGLASRVVLDAVAYGVPATTSADSVFRGEVWPTYDVTPITTPLYFSAMARYSSIDNQNNYYDFAHYMVKTPGVANPPVKSVSLFDIQYSTDTISSLYDSTVTCSPLIVTAVFGDSIYYVSSNTPGAWNGICVYRDIRQVSWVVGDSIRLLHGFVYENYKKTEIRSAGMNLYAPGNNPSAAVATEISISNIGEPYEGVLVKIDSLIVVTAPDVNGEWKCINFIGDTLIVDNLASYTVPSVGDTLKSITGILDYSFGFYKIQPRNDNDIEYLLVYNWSGTVSLSDAPADSSGTIVTIREISVADTTDIHGAFSFTSVPEDTYTMVFEHIGYITDSLTYFLKGGAITNITLNKYPTYTLSGIVGLNDDPADSFGISISLTDSVLSQNIATDSSGYYEFTDLAAGDYTVVITKSYYTQDSVEISLSSDTTYNTSIDRLTGTVWGYAGLDDNPADSSGTIVALSGYSLYDTTGTNGMYEFTNLYQGYTYTMIFTHDTYQADTSDIFLDLSSKRVDVTLTKLAGISDDMPEKVIVESTDGAISFTYNKSVDAPTSMQLFDLTGRSILTEEILGSKGVYKLSVNKKLSKGVYFLQITGEDKPFIKKFVIVK